MERAGDMMMFWNRSDVIVATNRVICFLLTVSGDDRNE